MTLQDFGFERSRYERPGQRWVCGHAADGRPCRSGPDPRGRCSAGFECRPLRRGDRWQCTRGPEAGGPCAAGPRPDGRCGRPVAPCQPLPALRIRRGRLTFWIGAATLGLLAATLYGPRAARWIQPGPLSRAHAALADCAACHPAAGAWLASATTAARSPSARCLDCHPALGPHALAPHGEEPAQLAARSEIRRRAAGATSAPWPLRVAAATGLAPDPGGELACAVCHDEHRGGSAPAPKTDDLRCQACHVAPFRGFVTDHPPFADYPHERRSAIAFDHRSHLGHFQDEPGGEAVLRSGESGLELDCGGCHRESAERGMHVGGFREACSSCHHHGEQIRGAGAAAAALLRLPALDVDTLEGRGFAIGGWPRAGRGPDSDAPAAPLLALLLSADAGVAADLERLRTAEDDGIFLFDLYQAAPDQLAAASRVGWAVKQLVADLAADPERTLGERLSAAGFAGRHDLAGLAGRPPADTARATRQELRPALELFVAAEFPGLGAELTARGEGRSPAVAADPEDSSGSAGLARETRREWGEAAGWSLDARDAGLCYRPAGHADPVVRGWLDLTGRSYSTSPAARAVFDALAHPARGLGRCTKCHAVEEDSSGSRVVRWTATPLAGSRSGTIRFRHRPHLVATRHDCAACHRSTGNGGAPVAAAYYDDMELRTDPHVRHPSFRAIAAARCAACHRPGGAPDGCVACHRYHAGPPRSRS